MLGLERPAIGWRQTTPREFAMSTVAWRDSNKSEFDDAVKARRALRIEEARLAYLAELSDSKGDQARRLERQIREGDHYRSTNSKGTSAFLT